MAVDTGQVPASLPAVSPAFGSSVVEADDPFPQLDFSSVPRAASSPHGFTDFAEAGDALMKATAMSNVDLMSSLKVPVAGGGDEDELVVDVSSMPSPSHTGESMHSRGGSVTMNFSRLPSLIRTKPDTGAVALRELREIEQENKQLQFDLNNMMAQAHAKTLQCTQLAAAERERGLPGAGVAPVYLQQQIWMVEQATIAEDRYTGVLKKLLTQSKEDARSNGVNGTSMKREVYLADRDLDRVKREGMKIVSVRQSTNKKLLALKHELEKGGEQNLKQLEQLGLARSTYNTQLDRRDARAVRRHKMVLKEAGDMDEEGEEALRREAQVAQRERELSSMTLHETSVHLNILDASMAKLRRVTGTEDTAAMIERFFAQQSYRVTLKQKVERTQATLELMEQKFEDAKAEERAVKILSGRQTDHMLQTTIIDLQEEIRTKRFHLKTGPSAKLAQSQYICTRCRDAMAGMVRRLDVLQVGGDRSLAQENPLPVELSHLKGVALEEETVLDVLPVLANRLVALLANFAAVVPVKFHHTAPHRSYLRNNELPDWLSMAPPPPPMTAESEEYSLAVEQDTSFLRREQGIGLAALITPGMKKSGHLDDSNGEICATGKKRRQRRRRKKGASAAAAANASSGGV